MPDTIHHIPIAAIDEAALVRDRTHLDPGALEELTASIAAEGLRMPVEVFALEAEREGRTHGLISGFRRLAAVRTLAAGGEGPATIAAFVRQPADMAEALAAMVEENEIREAVAPWDRGLMLARAVRAGMFETVDAAVEGLHPQANAVKRTRLRAYALVAMELEYVFAAPERFAREELMRIAAALRAGFGDAIEAAVMEVPRKDWARQREAALGVLAEAAGAQEDAGGRAVCRAAELRPGLAVRRVRVRGGWSFRFSGPEATAAMLEPVFIGLEARFGGRG